MSKSIGNITTTIVDTENIPQQPEFKELTQAEVDALEPKDRIEYLNSYIQIKQERIIGSKYALNMPNVDDDPNKEYGDVTKYYQDLKNFVENNMKWGGQQAVANNRFHQFIEVINVYEELNAFITSRKKDDIYEMNHVMFEVLYNLMLMQDGVGYEDAKRHMYLFRPVNNSYRMVDSDIKELNKLYQLVTEESSKLYNADIDYEKDESDYEKAN